MVGVGLISFTLSIAVGYAVLVLLRRFKALQPIKEYGPQRHYSKEGTPTMGGVAIILSLLLSLALFPTALSKETLFVIATSLLFSIVGLIDDLAKILVGHRGVAPKVKLFLQLSFSVLMLFFLVRLNLFDSTLWLPFIKEVRVSPFVYSLFLIFLFVSSANAVNITDGLDGLACGSSIIALFPLYLISLWQAKEAISLILVIMMGVLLGFLYYNRYPAKMFMGDVGSMFLGGFIAAISVLLKVETLVPFICGIFVLDTLSVIIQLSSYRLRKKRVFLMSPVHHHFELKGWKEPSVVILFWGVEFALSMLGLILYKLG